MAIGAHADDIELRVGGTLLKYLDCGYEIAYVMSTNNFAGKELSDKEGVKTLKSFTSRKTNGIATERSPHRSQLF